MHVGHKKMYFCLESKSTLYKMNIVMLHNVKMYKVDKPIYGGIYVLHSYFSQVKNRSFHLLGILIPQQ